MAFIAVASVSGVQMCLEMVRGITVASFFPILLCKNRMGNVLAQSMMGLSYMQRPQPSHSCAELLLHARPPAGGGDAASSRGEAEAGGRGGGQVDEHDQCGGHGGVQGLAVDPVKGMSAVGMIGLLVQVQGGIAGHGGMVDFHAGRLCLQLLLHCQSLSQRTVCNTRRSFLGSFPLTAAFCPQYINPHPPALLPPRST